MSNCQTQAGFFVLAPCDRPAAKTCGNCGNYVCDRHSHAGSDGDVYCQECQVERNKSMQTYTKRKWKDKDYDDWYEDETISWAYFSRHYYYENYQFQPFNEDDYAGFDEAVGFSALDDELGEGGFFDS